VHGGDNGGDPNVDGDDHVFAGDLGGCHGGEGDNGGSVA
jgi:hypothetical protein